MKLKRQEPGLYRSRNSRVRIRRIISQQTYRADEVCWEISIDGKSQPLCADTKTQAVNWADKSCQELGITEP